MSKTKYVIEIPDDIPLNPQFLEVYGTEPIGNKIRTYTIEMDETEELTADYINEHFSDLQDTAYQKGFEDGKAQREHDDKIEVGDEVEVLNSGNKYLIAWFAGTSLCGFAHDGVTCRLQPSDVRKTGRHFDIESILEAMKHD